MCITGNGIRAGQNAFSASRSMTAESLPPEKSITGFSNSAATSRMMWMASASRASRCVSCVVTGVKRLVAQPGPPGNDDEHQTGDEGEGRRGGDDPREVVVTRAAAAGRVRLRGGGRQVPLHERDRRLHDLRRVLLGVQLAGEDVELVGDAEALHRRELPQVEHTRPGGDDDRVHGLRAGYRV